VRSPNGPRGMISYHSHSHYHVIALMIKWTFRSPCNDIYALCSCFNVKSTLHAPDEAYLIAAEDSFTADDGAEGAEEWWGTDLGGGEGSSAGSDLDFGDEADGDFWSGDDGDDGLQPDGRGRAVGSNTRGILAIKPMHKGDGLPPRPAQGTGRGEGGTRERYTRQHVLTQYNKDTNALIRRKVKGATRARGGGLGGEGVRGGGGGGPGLGGGATPPGGRKPEDGAGWKTSHGLQVCVGA
jgi:hypothetical protein